VHVLTKILVVFAAILSLLLAALSVAFSINAGRVSEAYQTERANAQAVQTALNTRQAGKDQEYQALEEQISASQAELSQRQAEILQMQDERRDLQQRIQEALVRADANQGEIARLTETTGAQIALIATLQDEVRLLRDDELNWREERRALNDQINDLEGRETTLVETNRALREQIADIRRSGSGTTAMSNRAIAPSVVGQVTRVTRDPETQDLLVRINLGANDRLDSGMELLLTRGGDEYLGKLRLVRVDLQHAVGRLLYPVAGKDIRIGDTVRSESMAGG
jgi:septal ring factor EnvC (AmiA/AmiB activator)